MRLTERAIRDLEPRDGPYEVVCDGVNNLTVRVYPSDVLIEGMNRELEEECHVQGTEIRDIVNMTLPIGFFRWVHNAGLPGFLGVSRLSVSAGELEPNECEVHKSPERFTVGAENLDQLSTSVETLLRDPGLSIPLYANLEALRIFLKAQPELAEPFFD